MITNKFFKWVESDCGDIQTEENQFCECWFSQTLDIAPVQTLVILDLLEWNWERTWCYV